MNCTCSSNPRKIKRILNLIYFLSAVIQDDFEQELSKLHTRYLTHMVAVFSQVLATL